MTDATAREQVTAAAGGSGGASAARLSAWQLLCYGFLTMPLAMAGLALLTYLPTFYAIDMGLGLGLVGGAFVAGRLLDIVTDPAIGHLSDQTRSRFGPRLPWMAAGLAGYCIACWLLLVPPAGIGFAYLIAVGAGYFLFLTMLDIPYSSVGLELSPHTHERSLLASCKAGFQVSGAILAGFMPLLLAVSAAQSLPVIATAIVGLAVLGFALFAAFVPNRRRAVTAPRTGILAALRAIAGERRYTRLIGAFFIVQAANAFVTALAVLYITFVVQAPELVGLFIGLMFVSTALFLPLWLWLARRIGKARCWQAGIAVSTVALLAAPLIGAGDIVLASLLFCLIGCTFGCDAVMPTSILADISYEYELTGANPLSGMFLSVKNAASKLAFVAPMGLAFPVLGWLEFETAEHRDAAGLLAFFAFFVAVPVALKLGAILVLRPARAPAAAEAPDGAR